MESLVRTKLNILLKDKEPTFLFGNRKKVIYLTLGTDTIRDLVSNWCASDEISLSGHRSKLCHVGDLKLPGSHIASP